MEPYMCLTIVINRQIYHYHEGDVHYKPLFYYELE